MRISSKLLVSLAAVACLCAALLTSCMGAPTEPQPTPAEANRAYMAAVNSASSQAAEDLEAFSAAVAADDVASMKLAAQAAASDLAKIEALTPPEAFKEVHEEYVVGAQGLSAALSDYVSVFSRARAAGEDVDADAVAAEVADIQAAYDEALAHLAAADEKAAALAAGSTEEGASGEAGADGAQAEGEGASQATNAAEEAAGAIFSEAGNR